MTFDKLPVDYCNSMKTVALISVHSFVDVITNSSSELFVCETKKSVDSIKETLTVLAELYNKKIELTECKYTGGQIHIPSLFTAVFSDPVISDFTFDFHQYPRKSEWVSMFGDNFTRCSGFYISRYDEDKHPVLAEAHEQMSIWDKKNPGSSYPDEKALSKADYKKAMAKYQKHFDARKKASIKIYKKWNKMMFDITTDLHKWVAEQNGIDLSVLGKPFMSNVWGGEYGANVSYPNWKEDAPACRMVTMVSEALDWGYTFKKGDVFLRSADDNSIPYSFWPDIENTFGHVQRRHLG